MTMSFLLQDAFEELDPIDRSEIVAPAKEHSIRSPKGPCQEHKFRLPDVDETVDRSRLIDLLALSVEQYGATLICGRAGTGKTVLAADFARRQPTAAWYSIQASDVSWSEFSRSLAGAWQVTVGHFQRSVTSLPDASEISSFLTHCFENGKQRTRGLLVLDNVHHLFDIEWFPEFFRQLIVALMPQTRLLMLCRSRPNAPLWRFRSKQMLNVIDEPIITLTKPEAREICARRGLSATAADEAYDLAFGNIGKLAKLLDDITRRTASAGGSRAL